MSNLSISERGESSFFGRLAKMCNHMQNTYLHVSQPKDWFQYERKELREFEGIKYLCRSATSS